MKEYKCPMCNEWKKGSGIAMHIWNSHRIKYKEMTEKCEEREVQEDIKEVKELQEDIKEEKEIDYEFKENKITEEIKREYKATIRPNLYFDEDSEVINEWC